MSSFPDAPHNSEINSTPDRHAAGGSAVLIAVGLVFLGMLLLLAVGVAIYLASETVPTLLPPPPVVKISVLYPGASPEECESTIGQPVASALLTEPSVVEIHSVAASEVIDFYIIAAPGISEGDFLSRVSGVIDGINKFPELAEQPTIELYDGSQVPPQVKIIQTRCLVLRPDTDKLAAFGLSLGDVAQAVREGTIDVERGTPRDKVLIRKAGGGSGSLSDLEKVVLRAADGQVVLLRDVATIEERDEPSHRVKKWTRP